MSKRPIVIIEDDIDDMEILRDVFNELKVMHEIKFFDSCISAFDYLLETIIKPLLIISDINLPLMTGIQLKQKINEHDLLKRKSIPFIFLTTNGNQQVVNEAFDMMAQGYFVKPNTIHGIRETIKTILDYWTVGKHPHSD